MATPSAAKPIETSWQIITDNDAIAGRDRHYTHGLTVLRWQTTDVNTRKAIGIGQQIYTPDDLQQVSLTERHRPYAAWLYAVFAKHQSNGPINTHRELRFGVIGPAAGGKLAQSVSHRWFDASRPQGWSTQLDNEIGVMAAWHRTKKLGRCGGCRVRWHTHSGFAVGNVLTAHSAGLRVSFSGRHNQPLEWTSLQGLTLRSSTEPHPSQTGWFGHLGIEAAFIARDVFIDGNTFADSHRVKRRPWQSMLSVGLGYTVGRWRMTYEQQWRTRAFASQRYPDTFGRLTLSFNH